MSKLQGRNLVGLFVALTLAAGSASATNGYYTTGTGTKSKAQAGAGSANPQELMCLATNPASIAFVHGSHRGRPQHLQPDARLRDHAEPAPGASCAPGGACHHRPERSEQRERVLPDSLRRHELGAQRRGLPRAGLLRARRHEHEVGRRHGHLRSGLGPGPAPPVTTFDGTYGGGTAGVDLMQAFLNLTYARKFTTSSRSAPRRSSRCSVSRHAASSMFAPLHRTFVRRSSRRQRPDAEEPVRQRARHVVWVRRSSACSGTRPTMFSFAAAYTTKMSMGELGDYADLFAEQGGFDMPVHRDGRHRRQAERPPGGDVRRAGHLVQRRRRRSATRIQNLFNCPTAGFGGTDFEGCLGGNRGAGFGWDDMTVYKFGASWQLQTTTWTLRGGYSFDRPADPEGPDDVQHPRAGVMEDHFSVGFTQQAGQRQRTGTSRSCTRRRVDIRGPQQFRPDADGRASACTSSSSR